MLVRLTLKLVKMGLEGLKQEREGRKFWNGDFLLNYELCLFNHELMDRQNFTNYNAVRSFPERVLEFGCK